MQSILRQLAKYQPEGTDPKHRIMPPKDPIEIKQSQHPYEDMVERLCDVTDIFQRKRIVGDALLALHDFTPPPMVDQLYPIELAVLYHLFYRHKIVLCSESTTDAVFSAFLRAVAERDGGLNAYMRTLKNCLSTDSMSIFLYRVMLAALGARGKWDSERDRVDREYGIRAAKAMGVEPSARTASRGLERFGKVDIEHLMLGRITYIAFWEWSRSKPVNECGDYLVLPSKTILALPPHKNST